MKEVFSTQAEALAEAQRQFKERCDWLDKPETLLKHLQEKFPDHLPKNLIDLEHVAKRIGQQDVIRYLADTLKEYNR